MADSEGRNNVGTTGQVKQPVGSNSAMPRKKFAIIAIALFLAVLIIAVLIVKHHDKNQTDNTNQTQTSSPFAYGNDTFVDSKLGGTFTSLDFKVPQEYKLSTASSTIQKAVYLHSGANAQHQLTNIGEISAYATHYIIAENPNLDISAARSAFNEGQGSYQTYSKSLGINDFISSEVASNFFSGSSGQVKITLNKPKAYTSANLKDETWVFEYKADSQDSNNPKINGEVVFNIGKATDKYIGFNYLLIATPDYNWQANLQIWQKVADSLKVTEK